MNQIPERAAIESFAFEGYNFKKFLNVIRSLADVMSFAL